MEENCKKDSIKSVRETFNSLSSIFPDLNLSLTYTQGHSELHITEPNGRGHSVPISLITDTKKQIHEAIFSIKALLKRFDA